MKKLILIIIGLLIISVVTAVELGAFKDDKLKAYIEKNYPDKTITMESKTDYDVKNHVGTVVEVDGKKYTQFVTKAEYDKIERKVIEIGK